MNPGRRGVFAGGLMSWRSRPGFWLRSANPWAVDVGPDGTDAPGAEALRAALAGLPDADSTPALVCARSRLGRPRRVQRRSVGQDARGRRVWGKTGGRWGYNTAVGATRDLARTLVYTVNATDAKGQDTNPTALKLMVAAFGAPSS